MGHGDRRLRHCRHLRRERSARSGPQESHHDREDARLRRQFRNHRFRIATAKPQKHKLECAACYVDEVGEPVPTAQCQTCNDPKSFDQNYHLANGKATPHVSIHYAPETVNCALCHRERGFFVCGSDTRVRYNVSVLCDNMPGSLPSAASPRTRSATRRRVFQEAFNYVHHHRRR